MTAWFRGLSDIKKSLMALASAVVFGLVLAAAIGGHVGLPTKVETNTIEIVKNTGEISGVQQKMDRMICLQLLPDGDDPLRCP